MQHQDFHLKTIWECQESNPRQLGLEARKLTIVPHPITISLADDEQTLPGIDLPCFASFTQLKDEEGWNRLKTYFKKFAQVGLK